MRLISLLCGLVSFTSLTSSTILQNGQVRITNYPDTTIPSISPNSTEWKTYGANATELSYKGRWDSKHISWWAAPGLKFALKTPHLAITFGPYTSPGVLIAYRVSGLDWQFTNVSASSTHLFVSPSTLGINTTLPSQLPLTFELRVTNWAYGIQISNVHTSKNGSLIKVRNFNRKIEFIGDSLTSGMYATYEAFSGFGYGIGAGFGDTEFSITAYPGICLHDANCWGNPRGQTYQWFQTSDTSYRANQIWGVNPEPWNFARQQAADLVLINLGTNDNNTANNVTNQEYLTSYLDFVQEVHKVYPEAQIVIMSLWNGFNQEGSSYKQDGAFVDEIYTVYQRFTGEGWLHYFNSTGILQHNDIGPQYHPTDVGHIKIASHVMQYIRIKFGWEFASTGPEVQHETLYWNDEQSY